MAGETDRGNDAERNTELSPREIVEGILRRGDPAKRGLRPVIEAMAYARWRGWSKLEVEQYVRLNELLKQETGELETDVAEQLSAEIRDTGVIEGIEPVLDVLLAACDRLSAGRAVVKDFVAVFESRMEDAATGHETRRRVGDFLERLGRLGPKGHRRHGVACRFPLDSHLHGFGRLLDQRAPAPPGRAGEYGEIENQRCGIKQRYAPMKGSHAPQQPRDLRHAEAINRLPEPRFTREHEAERREHQAGQPRDDEQQERQRSLSGAGGKTLGPALHQLPQAVRIHAEGEHTAAAATTQRHARRA